MLDKLKKNFLSALIQALMICIVKVFTIPMEIWTGAVERLATQRTERLKGENSTEFPVLYWFKSAWDGAIFLSWIIALIVFLFAFFSAFATYDPMYFITMAVGQLISCYFLPILLSLLKESLTLFLSMALNLEKLAGNKSGNNKEKHVQEETVESTPAETQIVTE